MQGVLRDPLSLSLTTKIDFLKSGGASKTKQNQPTRKQKEKKKKTPLFQTPHPAKHLTQKPPPKQSQDSDLKVGAAVVRTQSSNLLPAH